MSIGNSTAKVVDAFLSSGSEPEQGYKACASLTKLGDRYGHSRLENACSKVWELTSTPSIRIISSMLKMDRIRSEQQVPMIQLPLKDRVLHEVLLTLRKEGIAHD